MAPNHSPRHQKRSRANDVAEKSSRLGEERAKRRRTSESNNSQTSKKPKSSTVQDAPNDNVALQEMVKRKGSAPWSFSRPVGGRYSNLDPVMTIDEAYLFVGLDSAVQVFATSTSRLLRTLQMETGQNVIGYQLCPADPEVLYIFTSGLVTKWHWDSGKRLARWGTSASAIAVDLPAVEKKESPASYSIVTQKDGKRQILISSLEQKRNPLVALETSEQINTIKAACGGRIIVASDGSHLFIGTTPSVDLDSPELIQYTWREASLPVTATCLHLRESSSQVSESKPVKGSNTIDLAIGETGGSILIYQDIFNILFTHKAAEKKLSPRKLHWHRSAVNTVRWSRDGNYLISGGQESVLVLWQLDTGRKQFLPHLSSPICNVVVSPNGNSYVVKLADNSVMVLSARELQSSTSVTGLQLSTELGSSKDLFQKRAFGTVAALHPQHPERLLVTVPASHQSLQQPSSAVLQTFDIRANSHISRQALARTNTTTLNISPEGTSIVAPDVRHMGIVQDGKWLATVDTWSPHPQDVAATASNVSKGNSTPLRSEVFLKFWKWNTSADSWELVTRIDGPHFNDSHHSTVLGLAARPCTHEFATLGEDAFIRFWCPTARHRSGLKTDGPEQQLDTWKCRGLVDLTASLKGMTSPLKAASLAFSEDGSVLAVCLPSGAGADDGLVLLINSRDGTVHYRRTGVFFGKPYSSHFLGRYLIVASTGSVSVWDTVDDVVKPIQLATSLNPADTVHQPLVAVNSRVQSFAVATREPSSGGNSSHKKRRKARFNIQIYDVPSFELVFQESLSSNPLSLLSDAYSGDYIIIDSTATVQRLGCLDKASQKSLQPREVTTQLDTGLANIFNRGHDQIIPRPIDEDSSASQNKALASVFGDTPSFSLPSIGVLFRNVVQTLGSS